MLFVYEFPFSVCPFFMRQNDNVGSYRGFLEGFDPLKDSLGSLGLISLERFLQTRLKTFLTYFLGSCQSVGRSVFGV